MIELPSFATQKELFHWLKTNEKLLIKQKKAAVKHADALVYTAGVMQRLNTEKAADGNQQQVDEIEVEAAINSTNWMDSHDDVHIPGLWDKSLQENKSIYLVQEHQLKFEKIISDVVTATVKNFTFTQLGIDNNATTQVLLFKAAVKQERNSYMFNAYRKGWVKNHSVGMQYVKLYLCINDDDPYYTQEKDNWNKYYPMIANKEVADKKGYFWAVTEAKIVEGSAVPVGSNIATPTISVNDKAAEGTLYNEPPQGTQQTTAPAIRWEKIAQQLQ